MLFPLLPHVPKPNAHIHAGRENHLTVGAEPVEQVDHVGHVVPASHENEAAGQSLVMPSHLI